MADRMSKTIDAREIIKKEAIAHIGEAIAALQIISAPGLGDYHAISMSMDSLELAKKKLREAKA